MTDLSGIKDIHQAIVILERMQNSIALKGGKDEKDVRRDLALIRRAECHLRRACQKGSQINCQTCYRAKKFLKDESPRLRVPGAF